MWSSLDIEVKNEWEERAVNAVNNSDQRKNQSLISNTKSLNLINSELIKIQEAVGLFIALTTFFILLFYYFIC
jgi:hypothetical protein